MVILKTFKENLSDVRGGWWDVPGFSSIFFFLLREALLLVSYCYSELLKIIRKSPS